MHANSHQQKRLWPALAEGAAAVGVLLVVSAGCGEYYEEGDVGERGLGADATPDSTPAGEAGECSGSRVKEVSLKKFSGGSLVDVHIDVWIDGDDWADDLYESTGTRTNADPVWRDATPDYPDGTAETDDPVAVIKDTVPSLKVKFADQGPPSTGCVIEHQYQAHGELWRPHGVRVIEWVGEATQTEQTYVVDFGPATSGRYPDEVESAELAITYESRSRATCSDTGTGLWSEWGPKYTSYANASPGCRSKTRVFVLLGSPKLPRAHFDTHLTAKRLNWTIETIYGTAVPGKTNAAKDWLDMSRILHRRLGSFFCLDNSQISSPWAVVDGKTADCATLSFTLGSSIGMIGMEEYDHARTEVDYIYATEADCDHWDEMEYKPGDGALKFLSGDGWNNFEAVLRVKDARIFPGGLSHDTSSWDALGVLEHWGAKQKYKTSGRVVPLKSCGAPEPSPDPSPEPSPEPSPDPTPGD